MPKKQHIHYLGDIYIEHVRYLKAKIEKLKKEKKDYGKLIRNTRAKAHAMEIRHLDEKKEHEVRLWKLQEQVKTLQEHAQRPNKTDE